MKTIDFLVQELPKCGGWPEGATGAGFICGQGELYFWDKDDCCPSAWTLDAWEAIEDTESEISRERYESALAAKNDGWIEWGGGECPVEKGALVDVKYRSGEINQHVKAGVLDNGGSMDTALAFRWSKLDEEYDIIAYRLHQPQEAEQDEADDEVDLNECIGQDAAPVWNGEGLPPVGVECEYSWAGEPWASGVIRYISKHTIIIETQADSTGDTECAYHPTDIKLRPFRTEADRKRDEAVKTIMLTGWCQAAAEEIYDLVAAGKVPGMKLED